jgi:hypothetical protein
MVTVYQPGVAQMVFSGGKEGQPWACVQHWKFDGVTSPWTQSDIQLLADTFSTAWTTYAAPHCPTTTTLTLVETVDLSSAAAVVGSNATQRIGEAAGAAIPNTATCAVLSCRIAARYRGGHPRIYLPWGTTADASSDYGWSQPFIASAEQAWANIVTSVRNTIPPIGGAQVSHVAVGYNYTYTANDQKHKYTKERVSAKPPQVIKQYVLNPTFGTQRRRLTTG